MSEELTEFAIKKQIELEKDIRKDQILNQNKIEMHWKKMEMQEYRREVKDASYTSLYIGDEGYLEIKKSNAFVDMP